MKYSRWETGNVSRWSNRTEDIAVDALGFILSRSRAARTALRNIVETAVQDIGELTGAKTQVTGDDGARPDLVVFGRGGKERVYCRSKVLGGTDGESTGYVPCPTPRRQRSVRTAVRCAREATHGSASILSFGPRLRTHLYGLLFRTTTGMVTSYPRMSYARFWERNAGPARPTRSLSIFQPVWSATLFSKPSSSSFLNLPV